MENPEDIFLFKISRSNSEERHIVTFHNYTVDIRTCSCIDVDLKKKRNVYI